VPPQQPGYQPQPVPPSGGKNKKTIIIVIVAIILLCCCVTVGAGFWFFNQGDNIGEIGRSLSDEPAPPGMTQTDEGMTGQAGTVAVWLSWDAPVDMDLEIWDAAGESMIAAAYQYSGDDIQTGGVGDEYFEFSNYSDYDFSTGEYVVSAYYVGSDDGSDPDATVTLTTQDIDGRVQTFTKTVRWDPGYDQWHAVRIQASTGQVTTVDEWY
jgi:hypothetical protein